ncbi:hypothetical protein [Lichenicola sp.]|uniref:hypothetical protein n=1 Tax=Lichenicola sp. TaxID=2804529 RepID=UPI003B00C4D3
MKLQTIVPLAALLALSACEVPSPAQRKQLDSMIGRSETDLVRSFGVPTRTFSTDGHTFLAYVDNESSYSPGSPGLGWGWGWGGWGWGGGGFGPGGFGGGWGGGYGGFGDGFGPSYYQSSCTTTFEVDGGRVASWKLRGDGC